MPCELRIRDDLSVNDIVEIAKNSPVVTSPHVGNFTPLRLTLPTLGVKVLCADHTIGIKDRNTHPHLFIQGGVAHTLSTQSDMLTTHASVTERVNGGTYPLGMSVSEVHVGALRKLYPERSIVTQTEHFNENREVMLSVLEEVTNLSPSLAWWRSVDSQGLVTPHKRKDLPGRWEDVAHKIFPLTNTEEGWLAHVRINILMDVILQSEMGVNPRVIHLSGPDMVHYIGGEMKAISRMYDNVRKRLNLREETITIDLVPFASLRFATRASQALACEELCTELMQKNPREEVLRGLVQEAHDVLTDPATCSYFTQHDSIATGEGVVIPEAVRSWTMETCAERFSIAKHSII